MMCARPLLLLLLVTVASSMRAQQDTTEARRGTYALVVYGGAGLSMYGHKPETPAHLDADANGTGLMGSVRVMWHPDHLLRLGIGSGFVPFYRYDFGEGSAHGEVDVRAVPLLLMWSMPVTKRGNVFLGYGYYRITSVLDLAGETKASTWSLGWMVAANYVQPLSERLGLGGELQWMNASETRNSAFGAEVMLQWRMFQW